MKMQCYKVTCEDVNGVQYTVGVMTFDENSAKHAAVMSLEEGRHIVTKAVKVEKTDRI